MLKILKKNKRGFSLIEMVVYVSILVFMLVIVLEVVVSITRSQRVIRSVRDIENSALGSLERIERETRGAESISTASSTFGVSPGVLMLISTDEDENPRTVEFYLSSGRLRVRENGVDAGALTEGNVRVTSLVFRRFATSTVEGIRTEVIIESGTSTHYRVENFYSSALVR